MIRRTAKVAPLSPYEKEQTFRALSCEPEKERERKIRLSIVMGMAERSQVLQAEREAEIARQRGGIESADGSAVSAPVSKPEQGTRV